MNDYKNKVNNILINILQELNHIKSIYDSSFHFDDIFSTENGGKTKLNRAFFNKNNSEIKENIKNVNFYIDNALSEIRDTILEFVSIYEDFNRVDFEEFIYEDTPFIDLLDKSISNSSKSRDEKNKIITIVKELNQYKNRFIKYKQKVQLFDIEEFENYINRLSVEELISSSLIYKILDTYALQSNELSKLIRLISSNSNDEELSSFESINSFLELNKRKLENFKFLDIRYIINLEYNININLGKNLINNISILESIIGSLIIQSSLDLIKKELKKGKFSKLIEVNIVSNRSNILVEVKNNGFEETKLYAWIKDNKSILEAKNLANMTNSKLDANVLENEGMKYTLAMKVT